MPRKPLAHMTTPEARTFDARAGQVDLWAVVAAADAAQLADEIADGQHDDYLTGLERLDASHYGGRPQVQAAIRARRG